MRRLPAATADAAALGARPRFGRPRVLGGAVAVLLAAAAVALVPRLARGPRDDEGSFSARGATVGTSMARGVGVTVYRARDALHPLSNGAVVGADEAFAVKYRSLLDAPAYLLAFAVDAKDAVHWICPAYLDAKSAPSSVRLAPTPNETLASSAMQLEAPPPGPMRIVAILTTEPLAAAQVDALDGGDLSTAALLARWPAADVRELVTVEVRPAP